MQQSQCKTVSDSIGGPIAVSRVQVSFVPEPTADGRFAISIKEIYDEYCLHVLSWEFTRDMCMLLTAEIRLYERKRVCFY
jgi:hypothetical protein